jgi:hypothetical protein
MQFGLLIVDRAMNFNPTHNLISEQDYPQGELLAETKHELINGQVYAMAEASENHNLLSLNEVFSKSTRRFDKTNKRLQYQQIPLLLR